LYGYCGSGPVGTADPNGKAAFLVPVLVVALVVALTDTAHAPTPSTTREDMAEAERATNEMAGGAAAGLLSFLLPCPIFKGGQWLGRAIKNRKALKNAAEYTGKKFPHSSTPNSALFKRGKNGEVTNVQTYDKNGKALSRGDYGSKTGRTDHEFPHQHDIFWPKNAYKNPLGSPTIGRDRMGLPPGFFKDPSRVLR
jgi:hypothetical protein